MGYCMDQRDSDFHVARENVADMAKAVRAIEGQFAWVSNRHNAGTVEGLFRAWRWEIQRDDGGDVVGINFCGEKLGDDPILFEAIAPYVQDGSYIEMQGEDGALWRWSFTDGKVVEQEGVVDFTPTDYHGKYIDLRARVVEALALLQDDHDYDPERAAEVLTEALE